MQASNRQLKGFIAGVVLLVVAGLVWVLLWLPRPAIEPSPSPWASPTPTATFMPTAPATATARPPEISTPRPPATVTPTQETKTPPTLTLTPTVTPIPVLGQHTFAPGETVSHVALWFYGRTVPSMWAWICAFNGLVNCNFVREGQAIEVPALPEE